MELQKFTKILTQSLKSRKIAVFCGAGISYNSGMPLVNQFVQYLLRKLDVPQEHIDIIINSDLPFESFMESVVENSNPDKLFDIFEYGDPNTNHVFLAKLAKANLVKIICTTNFDLLIERAFDDEGLIRDEDYKVYYTEAEFKKIDWSKDIIHLIKIHGSVENKEDMGITLKKVASEVLSTQRQAVINNMFSSGSNKDVLVLGYSCSDLFDIVPLAAAVLEKNKKVYFIEHYVSDDKVLNSKKKKYQTMFQGYKGRWVHISTDEVIKEVWKRVGLVSYVEPELTESLWESNVDEWVKFTKKRYNPSSISVIPGSILQKISQYDLSIIYYGNALMISREAGNKRDVGSSLNNLGVAYEALGNYTKAIEQYEQALIIAKEIGNQKGEGSAFGNLGLSYNSLGNYTKAIECHDQALKIARAIGNKSIEGKSFGNLGLSYHQIASYPKAIECHDQALQIAKETGDKSVEVTHLGNLGNAYNSLGDYQKVIEYYMQALQISRAIGDNRKEGCTLGGLGYAYHDLGDYQKAIECHGQTLKIVREIGDKHEEGSALRGLGNAYHALGDYTKALENYKKALIKYSEISDKQGEGKALGGLGHSYNSLGDFSNAIEYYKKALHIAKEIGDKQGEGISLSGLGGAYAKLGDLINSKKYMWDTYNCFSSFLPPNHPFVLKTRSNLEKLERT